jgi:hypothetical protein
VNRVGRLAAENLQHRRRDDFAARVRILAGNRHRLDVVLAARGVERQHERRRVHLAFAVARIERPPARDVHEPVRGLVAEAAASEMDGDPDPSRLVLEDVDVVVAAADRAELLPREVEQRALAADRRRVNPVEHRVSANRPPVLLTDAEADAPLDLIADPLQLVVPEVGRIEVRANGQVAARDVVADSRRGHVILVADDPADRHRVAEMAVGTENGRGVRLDGGAPLELRDRAGIVDAENLHDASLPGLDGWRSANGVGASIGIARFSRLMPSSDRRGRSERPA